MRNANITALFALAFLAILAVNCESTPPSHVLILVDRSDSVSEFRTEVLGLAETITSLHGVGRKSLLTIITTGDKSRSMEPILLGSIPIPKSYKLMETKNEAKLNAAFLKDVSKLLDGVPGQADSTPLYLALRRGVEVLRGQGCGMATERAPGCFLYATTDCKETEERAIRKSLYGHGKIEIPPAMTIQNSGIKVVFCGIADTNELTPVRNHVKAGRIEATWKGVFSDPDNVSLLPFCPRKEMLGDAL